MAERRDFHVHVTFNMRGGRKLVLTLDGAPWAPRPRVDNARVKALARAFRWRKMLDDGTHTTLEDLARAKGVAPSYVSRVLRLTLLAPEIVEAILDGRQPAELQFADLLEGFPLEWKGQRAMEERYHRAVQSNLPVRPVLGGRTWARRRHLPDAYPGSCDRASSPRSMLYDCNAASRSRNAFIGLPITRSRPGWLAGSRR